MNHKVEIIERIFILITKMNLFICVLICQFMMSFGDSEITDKSFRRTVLKVTTSLEGNEAVDAILKPTHQILANRFLPVWVTDKDHPDTLEKLEGVMDELGPFTMYQDPSTTAAGVFFHKQQEIHGIVDSRAIIEGLSLNPEVKPITKVFPTGVKKRKQSRFFQTPLAKTESRISVQFQDLPTSEVFARGELLNEENEITRLRRDIRNVNYIEVLVIVNYDMAIDLQKNPDKVTSIVSYVLTLFNNVDMLFAKVENPNMKFNLAGVIIVNSRESSPLHAGGECYEQIENDEGTLEDDMDVRCVGNFIKAFCHKHERTIPSGTYDVAILLTRYGLHQHVYNPKTGERKLARLGGLAESPKDDYYNLMKSDTMPTLVATVSDRGDYESFPILAHEIAHLFDVEHDEPTGETDKLMQPNGKHSANSLSWSQASRERLTTFFGSRKSCIFKNKPGSLFPPGPHKIWDADRQCECYGYKSANMGFTNRIRGTAGVSCDENIQCLLRTGEMEEGPIFRDGTPCGKKKVCWATECVDRKR